MTAYPKRLIEVDLPIKRISAHARREKSIRHGHISTLHIWWARRPLAACRAVICAALWPDPADPLCPQKFREDACRIINQFAQNAATNKDFAQHCSPENWTKWQTLVKNGGLDPTNEDHWNVLRNALLDFIADFANWDNSTVKEYLEASRALTQSAHEALGGEPGTRPLVVDPFAGGGSIPLEALRVGADAFASDLNPVAVLLNKVILEYFPKYGQRLADEVRKWGVWIKDQAEKELAEFYPKDTDGATPIAYLWARTIKCEGPGCGADVPLLGSLWLSRKKKPTAALKPVRTNERSVAFEVLLNPSLGAVGRGLTRGNKALCPLCEFVTPTEAVRRQLSAKNGGSSDARIIAVITSAGRGEGVKFRIARGRDAEITAGVLPSLKKLSGERLPNGLTVIPDEETPPQGALGYRFQRYGITSWRFLYGNRQLLALGTFTNLVNRKSTMERISKSTGPEVGAVIQSLLGLAVGRLNDRCSTLCRWEPDYLKIQAANGGQNKMPMLLDFVEVNPFGGRSGDWLAQVEWIAQVLENCARSIDPGTQATVVQSPAQSQIWPDGVADALVTDPPYYDAFGYSDLSEYFYVWLRRTAPPNIEELFSEAKPPKLPEAIAIGKSLTDRGLKDRQTYLRDMFAAFAQARKIVRISGVATIVFASKSTDAWEAILAALIGSGWVVTSSWPIDTEMAHRTRALDSAALNSSIHITCRPRTNLEVTIARDQAGDWRDVLSELPKRIHEWMPRLSSEGVVGADAIFACLGPALEIFSRYDRVEKASGEQVTLKEYLEYVWAAVAKEALNMIFAGADATGFEEDARLTAMWLWTLSTGRNGSAPAAEEGESESGEQEAAKKPKVSRYALEYDAARKIAQGLGAHLERLEHLVEIKGDSARLLPVSERARYLFGKNEAAAPSARRGKPKQLALGDILNESEQQELGWGDGTAPKSGNTVLDRVHQSMLLFQAGRSETLKRFLVDGGAGQDQRFWRLAQALSALYPTSSDEKRWVDGVLARMKGLGF